MNRIQNLIQGSESKRSNRPITPERKKFEVECRKRVDHFGGLVIDREIQNGVLQYPFDPQRKLAPNPIKNSRNGKLVVRTFSKSNFRIMIS